MKALHKGLAALLCAALCIGAGCAMAGGEFDAAEYKARWGRLLRFVTEEWPDWVKEDSGYASVTAKDYEQEKPGTPRDYSKVERLYLEGFNQAQFEEILSLVPNIRRLSLENCAVEDFSPLLRMPLLESLTLDWSGHLQWQLASLSKLPRLPALGLNDVPADADLQVLLVLTGLEKLELEMKHEGDDVCGLLPLGELPNLRSLTLNTWGMLADPLPDMPALGELVINAEIDLSQLKHTPALRTLLLSRVPVDADLSPLAALAQLETLGIWFGTKFGVDENPVLELPELPKLRSLAIYSGNHLGWWTVITSLPDMPALEVFNTNADIDPTLFEHTPALRELGFSGADDLTPLYDLPALGSLRIYGYGPNVTDYVDQLEALHEALPDLPIVIHYCC